MDHFERLAERLREYELARIRSLFGDFTEGGAQWAALRDRLQQTYRKKARRERVTGDISNLDLPPATATELENFYLTHNRYYPLLTGRSREEIERVHRRDAESRGMNWNDYRRHVHRLFLIPPSRALETDHHLDEVFRRRREQLRTEPARATREDVGDLLQVQSNQERDAQRDINNTRRITAREDTDPARPPLDVWYDILGHRKDNNAPEPPPPPPE
jgi:hypothetical protein